MNDDKLGPYVRRRREALSMSQTALASALHVSGSYVNYIESGRRRPSLRLLARIAKELGLDEQKLFRLAHPEAAAILKTKPKTSADAWRKFSGNKAIRARYRVTNRELDILERVNALGEISDPRHFLFILTSIRQSMDDDWP
jgi:transcriptional regulator with XRE-family HTH domain